MVGARGNLPIAASAAASAPAAAPAPAPVSIGALATYVIFRVVQSFEAAGDASVAPASPAETMAVVVRVAAAAQSDYSNAAVQIDPPWHAATACAFPAAAVVAVAVAVAVAVVAAAAAVVEWQSGHCLSGEMAQKKPACR